MPYYPFTINVQSPNQTQFFKWFFCHLSLHLQIQSTVSSLNKSQNPTISTTGCLKKISLKWIVDLSPEATLNKNSVAFTCKWMWVCVHIHTYEERLYTVGIGRLHSGLQTHLDLTVTLYVTSLPATLNRALTHSHLFHSDANITKHRQMLPLPTHQSHIWIIKLELHFEKKKKRKGFFPKTKNVQKLHKYKTYSYLL